MALAIERTNAAWAPRLLAPPPAPLAPKRTKRTWVPPVQGEYLIAGQSKHDPVNLYFHGTLAQVNGALSKAGWTRANPMSTESEVRFALVAIPGFLERLAVSLWNKLTGRHDQLTNADPLYREVNSEPVGPLSYHGKSFAVAYEKDNNPFGGRHHLRVYDTGQVDENGEKVWAVAASRDTGLVFDPHRWKTAFLNHKVEKNADLERDVVLRDLRAVGEVRQVTPFLASWGKPGGMGIHSEDGRIYDVTLA